MTVSGSFDYSLTRDNISTDALEILGVIRLGATPSSAQLTSCATTFNMMIKAWQNEGINLHQIRTGHLLLTKSTQSYSLGPSGDHFTESMVETDFRVAGVASDVTLEVDSTTGMTAADNALIYLDDGTTDATTIGSVTDSDTFVVDTGLSSAAAIDNSIKTYTTKAQRPLQILHASIRDSSNVDSPLTIISRDEYWELPDKTSTGTPSQVFYDPQLTNGTLYIWPTATATVAAQQKIMLSFTTPTDDLDAAGNNPAFPQEALLALSTNLAILIAPKFGVDPSARPGLFRNAASAKKNLMDWDAEKTSVFFLPDTD